MHRRHSAPIITNFTPSINQQPSTTTETGTTATGLKWDLAQARLLLFLFVCTLVLTVVHIHFLPPMAILKQKLTDVKMPVYTIIGMITSLVAALAFGRPYSPAAITIIGFFANVVTSYFLPGIMDWFEKSVLLVVIYALFVQYAYIWRKRIFSWFYK